LWSRGHKKRPHKCGLSKDASRLKSALTGLEARIALADHENLAATAHNLAVTVPLFGGLQRGKHLHGQLLTLKWKIQAGKYSHSNGLSQAQSSL
jgi:hypothetical protein